MQLHTMQSNRKTTARRVGRGGKRGTYSGRGSKGQHSRAGRRIRPAFRDLLMRIPKQKGFSNKPHTKPTLVVNISDLRKLKVAAGRGAVRVSPGVLREMNIIPGRFRGEVKLLASGEMDFPVRVTGLKVSSAARAKIEKAGGEVA